MLCIGSSLEVYPVAQLPQMTLAAGGKIAVITQGSTPYDEPGGGPVPGDVEEELEASRGPWGGCRASRRGRATPRRRPPALGARPPSGSARTAPPFTCSALSGPDSAACAAAATGFALAPQLAQPLGRALRRRIGGELGDRASSATSSCSAASRRRPSRRRAAPATSAPRRPERPRDRRAARPAAPGAEYLQPPQPGVTVEQLARVGPQAVGHLLAGAEARSGPPAPDRRRPAIQVRIGGHQPKRVQRAVEDLRARTPRSSSPALGEPGARLSMSGAGAPTSITVARPVVTGVGSGSGSA